MQPPVRADLTTDSGSLVRRVVGWLRAGYPDGVPDGDYIALLGILRRNLTPTEVDGVVAELTADADAGQTLLTREVVRRRIEDVVKGPILSEDLGRVSARLAAAGWPLGPPLRACNQPASPNEADGDSPGLVSRVVDWLREGYPTGLPEQDFVPLVALLRRRLTDEEVATVADRLVEAGLLPGDRVEIGTAVSRVTSQMPGPDDVQRVRDYLVERGWPVAFDD